MKKLLLGIAVVILILAAIVFYQRQRISLALHEVLKGKTYQSYGIKIEIPPSDGKIRGIFRPYVNVPRVIFNLQDWGLKMPLNFEKAMVFQDLWGDGGLVLEIPRKLSPRKGLAIEYPAVELGFDQSIKVIGANSISFQSEDKEGYRVTLSLPQVKFGNRGNSLFPDRMLANLEGVEAQVGPADNQDSLLFGSLNLGLESSPSKENRNWKIFFVGDGGVSESSRGKSEIGHWEFISKGHFKEIPGDELKIMIREIRDIFLEAGDVPKSVPGKKQDAVQANEGARLAFLDFSGKVLNILGRLQLALDSKDFQWEGLKIVDSTGGEKVLISPVYARVNFSEPEGALNIKAQGLTDQIRYRFDPQRPPLIMEGLSFSQQADYGHLNFSELLGFVLKYYRFLLTQVKGSPSGKNLGNLLLSSLAQYPDQAKFDFKIDRLSYQSNETKARHRNLNFGGILEKNQLGYWIRDEFDFNFEGKPDQSIRGGEADFSLTFLFPWDRAVALSRNILAGQSWDQNVMAVLIQENMDLNLKLLLDFGPNFFSLDLQSNLNLPLKESPDGSISGPAGKGASAKKWGEGILRSMAQSFIHRGTFSLNLKISRLSKLQGALESFKSGASLGLAVLAPYSQIDPKADTMIFQLGFKEGKIQVSGQPNLALQQILQPFFRKLGATVPQAP